MESSFFNKKTKTKNNLTDFSYFTAMNILLLDSQFEVVLSEGAV